MHVYLYDINLKLVVQALHFTCNQPRQVKAVWYSGPNYYLLHYY